MSINHYIVIFNAAKQELINLEYFDGDSSAALDRLSELEEQYLGDRAVQVILFGSESLEQLKLTHPHYFYDSDALRAAA